MRGEASGSARRVSKSRAVLAAFQEYLRNIAYASCCAIREAECWARWFRCPRLCAFSFANLFGLCFAIGFKATKIVNSDHAKKIMGPYRRFHN